MVQNGFGVQAQLIGVGPEKTLGENRRESGQAAVFYGFQLVHGDLYFDHHIPPGQAVDFPFGLEGAAQGFQALFLLR